jgi:hypothetical protein
VNTPEPFPTPPQLCKKVLYKITVSNSLTRWTVYCFSPSE